MVFLGGGSSDVVGKFFVGVLGILVVVVVNEFNNNFLGGVLVVFVVFGFGGVNCVVGFVMLMWVVFGLWWLEDEFLVVFVLVVLLF